MSNITKIILNVMAIEKRNTLLCLIIYFLIRKSRRLMILHYGIEIPFAPNNSCCKLNIKQCEE